MLLARLRPRELQRAQLPPQLSDLYCTVRRTPAIATAPGVREEAMHMMCAGILRHNWKATAAPSHKLPCNAANSHSS